MTTELPTFKQWLRREKRKTYPDYTTDDLQEYDRLAIKHEQTRPEQASDDDCNEEFYHFFRNCPDLQSVKHHDAPAAPERGETNAEQVKALAADWSQKSRLEQIIARHQMHNLSGLPNREYTASWEDVKLLIEEHSTLIAQRERLLEALKGVAIMLNTELEKYDSEPWAQRVREAITTSEQEGRTER